MVEVSVIIPVYNVETKLRRCIESIINQSFSDFELILVDDGSTDCSGSICDEYAQKQSNIHVIHQKNSGVSSARNKGIACSNGKYITFVDSDDYVEGEYLQVLYDGMKNDCELAVCGIYFCSEDSDEKVIQKEYEDFEVVFDKYNVEFVSDLLKNRRLNYVFGKLYRRDIIVKHHIKFQNEIALGEDTIFVMDYLRNIKVIHIIGQAYYNYVGYKEGTLTHRFYNDLFERLMFINRQIIKLFEEKNMMERSIIDAVDLRVLYATVWTVNIIRKQESVSLKRKLGMIKTILYTNEVTDALRRNTQLDEAYPEVKIMRKKSPLLLLLYYVRVEVIEQKIKIIIVKIVPKRWIRRGKKCVSNVQSLFRRIMQKNI